MKDILWLLNIDNIRKHVIGVVSKYDLPCDVEIDIGNVDTLYYLKKGIKSLGYSYNDFGVCNNKMCISIAKTKHELELFEKER